jgi:hypothetical protein
VFGAFGAFRGFVMKCATELEQPDRAEEQPELLNENTSFFGEVFQFMRENKKWWLIPIVVVMALFAGLIILGATGAAPFVYTLF